MSQINNDILAIHLHNNDYGYEIVHYPLSNKYISINSSNYTINYGYGYRYYG